MLRGEDITSLDLEWNRSGFLSKAAHLKSLKATSPDQVDLRDVRSALHSICARYPLVVIERERSHPGECEIGRIVAMGDDSYNLRRMTPSAEWERDERTFRFDDVTRVLFDGEYENTLAMVADTDD